LIYAIFKLPRFLARTPRAMLSTTIHKVRAL
jgi:hypothetical protein